MAEEGRFELPRRVAPTYSFSKAAPSATWVLLHAREIVADNREKEKGPKPDNLYIKK
jgi:hypothetical protein